MTDIPPRASGRVQIVTDRSSPHASITSSVSRADYNSFTRIAIKKGISRAALLRELVEKHIAENDSSG